MSDIFTQIKNKYNYSSLLEKLIFINILVFLLTYIIGGFNSNHNFIVKWLALPSDFNLFLIKPWTIITYGFMHGGFPHLLFNLITLYYIGNIFVDYFIPRKLLTFYLYGTLFGGIIFILSYNLFPILQQDNIQLVGASSGIMAILIGLATYMPNYEIKFRFIGFIKLWIIATIFIGLDLVLLSDNNTGGHLAHLGGGLFGFLAIYSKNQISFTNPFKNTLKKKSPLKTTYKSNTKRTKPSNSNDVQQQINMILDKISKSGYDSLSKAEKEFLFQQGKK